MKTDTIAAISTAVGNGGISIVRISGPDAITAADRVFRAKSGKRLADADSHTMHYGVIVDGDMVIDEVMAAVMRAPKTYTTEDIVEIDCHGGAFVTQKVLETIVKAGTTGAARDTGIAERGIRVAELGIRIAELGIRIAEPGEFTKRAFLNGRIDLTKAEAVMDVIEAQNAYALKSSVGQLGGAVSIKIENLREQILHALAFIEAVLDDPEHMSFDGYGNTFQDLLDEWMMQTDKLLASFDNGRMLQEGIRTVILGKPNAGKSSLLNLLAGQERAIVTDIPGTTRDVLEERLQLGGITLLVMDTAGIRQSEDQVEQIGIERAKRCAEEADLILYVADASTKLDESDLEILQLMQGKKAVVLLNKQDLDVVTNQKEIEAICNFQIVPVSAKKGTGIDKLEKVVSELVFQGTLRFNNEVYLTNLRQKTAIEEARKSLLQVQESVDAKMPEDFYTIDLMNAYESFGRVIGKSVEDDLVDEIFSKFCMGK